MGTEITKTRFQHICAASKDEFTLVCADQMKGITLRSLCENPADYLSMGGIARTTNERQQLMRVIQFMLGDLYVAINVKSNLKPSQFPILASHIVTEYGFMSLEAVYLCFKQIILGEGEEIYRVDIPFICNRLSKFDDDWYAEFSRIRDSKHGQDKGSMKTQFTDAAVQLYRKHERG